jgi:hypothetical protein
MFAQVDRSTLSGTITDSSGAAIPAARISIASEDQGFSREILSEPTGAYRFSALPIGRYKVSVAKEGFSTAKIDGVGLAVGVSRTLDIQLQVGQIATQVEVTAAATPLEQTTADIGSVVESKQIQQIPINGRNWAFLMALAPGAVNTGEGSQNSIRFFGRSRDENNWTYDGVDATGIKDPRQEGGLRLVISLDSIAEFKVNSSTYTAESGTGAGGQVNLVSKTGTNDFHGSAFWFLRNSALDARRPFDPAEIPLFQLNQYGGSIGGPIVKNRTFFFANYEGLRQRLGQSAVNGLVPSAAFRARVASTSPSLRDIVNGYPAGQQSTSDPDVDRFIGVFNNRWEENAGSLRVDHRISDKHLLFGRFNMTDGNFNDRRTALLEYRTSFVRPTNATLQWQALLGPSVVNEAKIGMNRSALSRPQAGLFEESFVVPSFTTTLASAGIREVPSSYSIVDHLSWVRGRHTLKAGGEVRRIHMNSGDEGGVTVRYANKAAFLNNVVDRFEVAGVLPMFGGRRTYWIGYAQDEWRVTRNFVLNLGARYENYTVMQEVNGRGRVFDFACNGFCPSGTPWYQPDRNNIAPRFGFAWSVAPKTVVRGGYGLFYGVGQNDDVTAAIDSEPERLQLTNAQRPGLTYPITPFLPEARSQGAQPRALQRDREDFYSQQWSFSIQQELAGAFVAQLGYVGNRGSHLFGRDRVNLIDPVSKVRPLPSFSDLDRKNNYGNSTFHGMQASIQRNFFRGWLFQGQYMWSKVIDDNAGSGDGAEIMIASCRRCERAPADWDIRHTATFNSVYDLPFGPGRRFGAKAGFTGKLIEGWSLSGMYTVRTGRPFSALVDRSTGAVPDGNARNQRAQLTGANPVPDEQIPDRWINPGAFRAPANGTWGDSPRNMLRAPGLWQVDAGLTKRTPLTESVNLEFRAEAFNLFNRAQFGTPANNISRTADFGVIRTTANDGATGFGTSRMLQFMLRLNF